MKNAELKKILLAKNFGRFCEECKFPADDEPLDLHHVLIHDKKRFHDVLTVEENCTIVCRFCHPYCNSIEWKMAFLKQQIERLGKERMREWWNKKVPIEIKRHNDYNWIEEALK